MAVDGPALLTDRSAEVPTVVVAEAELLASDESVVPAFTVAVLVTFVPEAVDDPRRVVTLITADDPTGRVPIVSLTEFPVFAKVNAGPLVCDWLTNVVPAGNVSATDTDCASDGPLFATVMVYVRFPPAVAVGEAVLVIDRSAPEETVVEAVAELLVAVGSVVLLLTWAVLFSTVPPATLGATWTVKEMVAELPDGKVAMVSLTVFPELLSVNAGPEVWV